MTDLIIPAPIEKREEIRKILEGLNMKIRCYSTRRITIIGCQNEIYYKYIVLFEAKTTDKNFENKLNEMMDKVKLRGAAWQCYEVGEEILEEQEEAKENGV